MASTLMSLDVLIEFIKLYFSHLESSCILNHFETSFYLSLEFLIWVFIRIPQFKPFRLICQRLFDIQPLILLNHVWDGTYDVLMINLLQAKSTTYVSHQNLESAGNTSFEHHYAKARLKQRLSRGRPSKVRPMQSLKHRSQTSNLEGKVGLIKEIV